MCVALPERSAKVEAFEHEQLVALKKPGKFAPIAITPEEELEALLKTHSGIAPLPSHEAMRKDLAALAPKHKKCVYVMMDSGASPHAAWLKKHAPFIVDRWIWRDSGRRPVPIRREGQATRRG